LNFTSQQIVVGEVIVVHQLDKTRTSSVISATQRYEQLTGRLDQITLVVLGDHEHY